MIALTPSTEKKLERASVDHAAAEARIAALQANEGEAAESPDGYAQWQAELAKARAERARLAALISKLLANLETEKVEAAASAQRKLEASYERTKAGAVKLFIRNHREMIRLAHESLAALAAAEEERLIAQRGRAEGLPPIESVEQCVWGAITAEEEILSTELVHIWFYEGSDQKVPEDRLSAIVRNGDRGTIKNDALMGSIHSKVVRRQARKITFRERQAATQRPSAYAEALKIPAIEAGQPAGWTGCANRPALIRKRLEEFPQHTPPEPAVCIRYEILPAPAKAEMGN